MNYSTFNRALTYIERNPKEWDQSWPSIRGREPKCLLAHVGRICNVDVLDMRGLCGVGQDVLGVSEGQAEWIFYSDRTLDDFRRLRLIHARGRLARTAKNFIEGVQAA